MTSNLLPWLLYRMVRRMSPDTVLLRQQKWQSSDSGNEFP